MCNLKAFKLTYSITEFPQTIGFAETHSKIKANIARSLMDVGYAKDFIDGICMIKSCHRAKEFDVLADDKSSLNTMDFKYAVELKNRIKNSEDTVNEIAS